MIPEWLEYPKKFNACEELLDRNIRRGLGKNTAIKSESQSISYLELLQIVSSFSKELVEIGVEKQHRIIIRTTNSPEFIIALLSLVRLGAIAVPTHQKYSLDELRFIVKDTGAKLGLGTGAFLEDIRNAGMDVIKIAPESIPTNKTQRDFLEHVVSLRADSPCLILYTSGTTGRPKGCLHTHRDYLAVSDIYGGIALRVNQSDIITSPASLAFAFGNVGLLAIPFRFGSTVALYDKPRFDPSGFLDHLTREKVTIVFGVPTMYRALLKLPQGSFEARHFADRVRICVSAGEICGPELAAKWQERFKVKILEHLGSTEMLDGFIGPTLKDKKEYPIGSLGKPLPGYRVRFWKKTHLDKESKLKVGEILVRGPVTIRYWNRPRDQAKVSWRGWNRIHDVLGLDSNGVYWYVSRSDDIIKTAGYRVAPHEVERALQRNPLVSEVAVVGVPDTDRGNIVVAFVVIVGPPSYQSKNLSSTSSHELMENIRKSAEEHLASYKLPAKLRIVQELPKTSSGKINRRELLAIELGSKEQVA